MKILHYLKSIFKNRKAGLWTGLLLILLYAFDLIFSSNGHLTEVGTWFSDGKKWLLTFFLLVISYYWEKDKMRSLGIKLPSWQGLALIPVVTITIILAQQFIGRPLIDLFGGETDRSALIFIQSLPIYQQVIIVLTAGITEEIIFRSYLIERFEELTKSTTVAVTVSIVFFVGVHIPAWGIATGILQMLIALIMALTYIWRRNIFVPIGAHLLLNSLGVFLSKTQ
ncbi:MAG: CPBP family intramembrane glutamic endopeptidase [Balneolaceae bacterium]|nr:CPBP family intramembrane glutamic endopeptidase [Balneolaceae bacterium]